MAGGKGIRRVVELALDAISARRMRDDAQRALAEGTDPRKAQRNLSAAESAMERIRGAAIKLGAAFAAAFALDKIRAFGVASVRAAMEAEAGWARLGSTLRNVGVDLEAQRARIEAAAGQVVDGSVFDDDAVVAGLQRMTALTGDYEGSLARLGIVADLAADQQITFEDASERVAKIMNGGTRELKAYGLEALGAERGLAALGDRLEGSAAAQAATFSGQLQILNRDWGEFQEAVGAAIIAGGEGTSVMGTLRGALSGLTGAVEQNREGLAGFVRAGVRVTITAIEGLINGFRFLSAALSGRIMASIGRFVEGWSKIVDGFALAVEARAAWNRITGDSAEAAQFEAQGRSLRLRAEQLRGVAAAYRQGADEALNFQRITLQGGDTSPAPTAPTPRPRGAAPPLRPRAGEGSGGGGRRSGPAPTAISREPRVSGAVQIGHSGDVFVRDALLETGDAADQTRTKMEALSDAILSGSEVAADAMTHAFGSAFAMLWEEGTTLGDMFGAFFKGIGQAATGALAEYAGGKSKENFLKSAEDIADGIAALSNPLTASFAPGYFRAAAQHAAVGAAWGAAFGLSSGAGNALGKGGGGAHGGYQGHGRRTVDNTSRQGPEVHLYFDGPSFLNPKLQNGLYGAVQLAEERLGKLGEGARVTIHERGR